MSFSVGVGEHKPEQGRSAGDESDSSASSEKEDADKMDLQKALKIVSKHYSRRNAQFTCRLPFFKFLRRLHATWNY